MSEMVQKKHVVIEDWKPFSDSLLWDSQENLYKVLGPSSWGVHGVPFYITSTPFVADYYARVTSRYLQKQKLTMEPLYLFELGMGSGRFTYLYLKYLEMYCSHINFCLVVVDCVKENLTTLQNHPLLQKWIEKGYLDFALWNPLKEEHSTLWKSGLEVGKGFQSSITTCFF